jgi:hypothetical protein
MLAPPPRLLPPLKLPPPPKLPLLREGVKDDELLLREGV